MDSVVLKCPKCGYPRKKSNVECTSCGIVFEKYAARQQRVHELEITLNEDKARRQKLVLKLLLGFTVAALGGAMLLFGSKDEAQIAERQPATENRTGSEQDIYRKYLSRAIESAPIDREALAPTTFGVGEARHRSTAFFVTDSCLALTSKISLEENRASRYQKQLDNNIDYIVKDVKELEEKLEILRDNFIATCEDCSEKAFQRKGGSTQRRLSKKRNQLEEAVSKRNSNRDSKLENHITLSINQKRQDGRLVETSHALGISLISTENNFGCDQVSLAEPDSIQKGDKFYLLNGHNSVGSRVVTGFSKTPEGHTLVTYDRGKTYSNNFSGAPAFNAKGKVIGISIAGIGKKHLLVPIEDALHEFRIVP